MKRFKTLLTISVLIMSAMILFSGCKKKSEPITPTFMVTATTVAITGGDGLQFYAKCSNVDVKMTKVLITDPIGANTFTYNLNGDYYLQNEIFSLQADDEAYLKLNGAWSFIFVGNLTSDNSSFSVTVNLNVSK